jgi:DNA uptake protein ComE-like DNA-binding protein
MRTFAAILLSIGILASGSAYAQMGNNAEILNPNLAEEKELVALPHMTPGLVSLITSGRPFLGMPALDAKLSGALSGEARAELYQVLFLPINLNTASEDEVMLVPGMSGRMAHEFEEYRPYTSLDQFRREIGKYVNEAEVARFEQYVFIPMNLNTADLDHFATIPGMTPRMVHEFEEYRPYKNMDQFRREIGKYVDEDEVARLERYVTLD